MIKRRDCRTPQMTLPMTCMKAVCGTELDMWASWAKAVEFRTKWHYARGAEAFPSPHWWKLHSVAVLSTMGLNSEIGKVGFQFVKPDFFCDGAMVAFFSCSRKGYCINWLGDGAFAVSLKSGAFGNLARLDSFTIPDNNVVDKNVTHTPTRVYALYIIYN